MDAVSRSGVSRKQGRTPRFGIAGKMEPCKNAKTLSAGRPMGEKETFKENITQWAIVGVMLVGMVAAKTKYDSWKNERGRPDFEKRWAEHKSRRLSNELTSAIKNKNSFSYNLDAEEKALRKEAMEKGYKTP